MGGELVNGSFIKERLEVVSLSHDSIHVLALPPSLRSRQTTGTARPFLASLQSVVWFLVCIPVPSLDDSISCLKHSHHRVKTLLQNLSGH